MREKLQFRQPLKDFRRPLAEVVIFRCVLGQFILLVGFSLTIAMRAIFMLRFEPVFVMIYSAILLRERLTLRKIILITVLLIGGFLFITDLSTDIAQNVMIGDLLVILALVFLAYSYLPSAKISKKISPITVTITSNVIAAIIIAPIIGFVLPLTMMVPDMTGLTYVLVYAILFYVFGVFLWFKALSSVKPWVVASVLALEPIAGALLAFFWLGQTITAVQFFGAVAMIAATHLIARNK